MATYEIQFSIKGTIPIFENETLSNVSYRVFCLEITVLKTQNSSDVSIFKFASLALIWLTES